MSNEPGGDPSAEDLTVADSSFTGNEGGGLAAFNSDLGVSNTEFKSNTGTATYVETSDKDRGFDLEVRELVGFELLSYIRDRELHPVNPVHLPAGV